MKLFFGFRTLLVMLIFMVAVACGSSDKSSRISAKESSLTGWKFNDPKYGNFEVKKNYEEQKTPSGMVFVEGGSFTMGAVQEDIMGDWSTTPRRIQMNSFYLDETEVTNAEYMLYLLWLKRVFPPSENNDYKKIYESALPDTLVWRTPLGNNESLNNSYFRHPAYANYPVVGVSWLQANDFCEWRTDRVNEKILMDMGVLNPLSNRDSTLNFSTETYYLDPNSLKTKDPKIYQEALFNGKHVKRHNGVLYPKFRLPTEAEWEYAAKALVENREYNSLKGRTKYPWKEKYSTRVNKKYGDQLANFKIGKGDYSGVPGWSSDGAYITNHVKAYPPNAYGLYDMAGNVAEWVYDVYRPIVDNDLSDLSYVRGNVFKEKEIVESGKTRIQSYKGFESDFDTLPNGRFHLKFLPGAIVYQTVPDSMLGSRLNYKKGDNSAVGDGEQDHSKKYDEKAQSDYTMYDSETTLISDQARVYKGGSWKDRQFWLDPAQRRFLPQYMATDFIGFRCALDRVGDLTASKKKKFHK
jgi:gliding motility-associated lipoprotein GldJ